MLGYPVADARNSHARSHDGPCLSTTGPEIRGTRDFRSDATVSPNARVLGISWDAARETYECEYLARGVATRDEKRAILRKEEKKN